jgi:hypothetical protein
VILVNWTLIQVLVRDSEFTRVRDWESMKVFVGVGVVQRCGWGCLFSCGLSRIIPGHLFTYTNIYPYALGECCSVARQLCVRDVERAGKGTPAFGQRKTYRR